MYSMLWTKNVSCHISKQRMWQLSRRQPLQQTPNPDSASEGIQGGEKEDGGPKDSGTYRRNNLNEPRLLHLPICRKVPLTNLRCLVFFN